MSYVPTDLGLLAGGTSSGASGCSGEVVVGTAVDSAAKLQAVYWDAANAIHVLAPLVAGSVANSANDVSADVGKIFGSSLNSDGALQPVAWSEPFNTAPVAFALPGGFTAGELLGCGTGSGKIVAGHVGQPNGTTVRLSVPCVWVNGTPTLLPVVAEGNFTFGFANDCAPDGSVVLGSLLSVNDVGQTSIPVVWAGGPDWTVSILNTIADVPVPDGSPVQNEAAEASTGGSVVVGRVSNADGSPYAASWIGSELSRFAGPIGGPGSYANHCDQSGTFVCGVSAGGVAAIWVNGIGQELPIAPGLTSVTYASALSVDAATICGGGMNGSGQSIAVKWVWTGLPIPGAGGPPTRGSPAPVGSLSPTFLTCGNDWTIAQPLFKIYGLDHLIGQDVVGLADGIPVGPLAVGPDGSVFLPFAASYVTLGLPFTVQLQTPYLDIGNPTVQGRRKDLTGATVRVDASASPMVGSNQPDGGSFVPTQVGPAWSNLQPSVTQDPEQFPGAYVSPSGQVVTLLFSGDFRANLQPGWDERGQIAVQQTLPLPLAVTSVMPEALQGDLPEQGISQSPREQGQDDQSGPGMWMLTSRSQRR